jgi:aminocarboxymuconate-semialdehyde decarboxylase
MFDYDKRIKNMEAAGVDVAVVSLTCPSVFWGGRDVSLSTTKLMNDQMSAMAKTYPEHIRFLATLPWQYPDDAVEALDYAMDNGASGVMALANVRGDLLIDPKFAKIWQAIDDKALPVLIHPTMPPGSEFMDLGQYNIASACGFMLDTTLCLTKMLYGGFTLKYPNLKIIGSHAGATIPFIINRMDRCWETIKGCREAIPDNPPSYYWRHDYFVDSVCYSVGSLKLTLDTIGGERVLFGSDYPHNIGDMAGILNRVDAMPAEERDKIRSGNAYRIFTNLPGQ